MARFQRCKAGTGPDWLRDLEIEGLGIDSGRDRVARFDTQHVPEVKRPSLVSHCLDYLVDKMLHLEYHRVFL